MAESQRHVGTLEKNYARGREDFQPIYDTIYDSVFQPFRRWQTEHAKPSANAIYDAVRPTTAYTPATSTASVAPSKDEDETVQDNPAYPPLKFE